MRIALSPEFRKFAIRNDIDNETLRGAIRNAEDGSIAARLGKHLVKLRLPLKHRGKSGGFRSVVVYVEGNRALFIYGFPKNKKADLTPYELDAYRVAAKTLAGIEFDALLGAGWTEVRYDNS